MCAAAALRCRGAARHAGTRLVLCVVSARGAAAEGCCRRTAPRAWFRARVAACCEWAPAVLGCCGAACARPPSLGVCLCVHARAVQPCQVDGGCSACVVWMVGRDWRKGAGLALIDGVSESARLRVLLASLVASVHPLVAWCAMRARACCAAAPVSTHTTPHPTCLPGGCARWFLLCPASCLSAFWSELSA